MRAAGRAYDVSLVVALLVLSLAGTPLAADTGGFRALSGGQAADFRLPGDVEQVKSFYLPAYGLTYERYQQFFGAAEVLGGQLTLYRDDAGNITTVIGAHYPNIAPTNTASLSKAQAQRIVERDIGAAGKRKVDLLINLATGRYFHRVETQRFDSRWFHWIDAGSGQVVNKFNGLAHGDGYGVAHDEGDVTDIKDLTGLVTFNGSSFELRSIDGRQETHDQGSSNKPFLGPVATDSDDHWVRSGYKSPGQPALVDAHYYARVTDDYLLSSHGFDWVAQGSTSGITTMEIHAHFTRNYNNAFWNGSYVVFGDGDQQIFRELTSLDVVGHELTHGVTDFTSNLMYQNESGALNESFSDVIGSSIEFYADVRGLEPAVTLSPDWLIGEDFDLRGDAVPGIRNMAKSHRGRRSRSLQ